jgi:hypothetical protein
MSRCDEIHKCDGQVHDPDTMVAPPTPNPTRKTEVLVKTPVTITSRREEDVALKKWSNNKEALTAPKPHTHPSHERDDKKASRRIIGVKKRKEDFSILTINRLANKNRRNEAHHKVGSRTQSTRGNFDGGRD